MLVPRIRVYALALATSALAGCSGGGTTAPGDTGNKGATTTTYSGTFADAKSSGTLSVAVTSSSASNQVVLPAGISAQVAGSSTASGTLVLLSGVTVSVTGSLQASTGALSLSGGSYSFSGTLAGGAISGSYNGPNGAGSFATQSPSATGAVARTYCGTYATGSDYGWFNLVISASGHATGLAVALLDATSVGISGTLTGSSLSATTDVGAQISATLSADGTALSGTYSPPGSTPGSGTFQGSTGGCPAAGASTIGGLWATGVGLSTSIHFALTQSGTGVGGSGIITVNFVPGWTGNAFTVTSGSITGSQVSFTAQLGANPNGSGGFWYGTLTFSGTVSGSTMTGTVVFTPPRTFSQTFAQQTVSGLSLTRN